MLPLIGDGWKVPFVSRPFLFGPGALVDAAVSAVVADPWRIPVVDGRFVHVVNDCDVHVVNGTIVEKTLTFPTPAFITVAKVAVAIVNSAIEAHHRTPETFVENEAAAAP